MRFSPNELIVSKHSCRNPAISRMNIFNPVRAMQLSKNIILFQRREIKSYPQACIGTESMQTRMEAMLVMVLYG